MIWVGWKCVFFSVNDKVICRQIPLCRFYQQKKCTVLTPSNFKRLSQNLALDECLYVCSSFKRGNVQFSLIWWHAYSKYVETSKKKKKKQEFETTECIILVLHDKTNMCMCTLFECQTLKSGKSVETTRQKKKYLFKSAPSKWMSYYLLSRYEYSSSPSFCENAY